MSMSDAQIAEVLDTTVSIAEPVLDILAEADPFGLKARTFADRKWWQLIPTSAAGAAAQALNVVDFPGTKGWDELDMNSRADWWAERVGALNTIAVAFPSLFGAWTRKIPLGTYLGAANQALVILAVGREYGITRRTDQIEMLAQVLFGVTIDGTVAKSAEPQAIDSKQKSLPTALFSALWEISKLLYQLQKSLGARPQSPKLLDMMRWFPVIGGPVSYVGERIALCRAVDQGRAWIVAHPGAVQPRRDDD